MSELIKFGPVSSKLLEMRELLAKPSGWCQGHYHRDGAHCLTGSFDPEGPDPRARDDWTPIYWAIKTEIRSGYVIVWNDSLPPGRKGQLIVCEMLERAALKEARAGR